MGFKAAIFDLDGVVVDTVPLHFLAWKKLFSEYEKKFTLEEYKEKVDGIPRVDGVKAILPYLSDKEAEEAGRRKQEYFLRFLEKKGVRVFSSTLDLIEKLKKEGIKVAVISSSKNCRDILKKAGIEDYFDVVVSSRDVRKGKPDPDIFLFALEKLGVGASEAVVFEDALLGVRAAKRANIKCVGIDRYGNPQRLKEADLVVEDVKDVTIDELRRLVE